MSFSCRLPKGNLAVNIEETEGSPKPMIALLAGTVDELAAGYQQSGPPTAAQCCNRYESTFDHLNT
jgi:hypothetical protein